MRENKPEIKQAEAPAIPPQPKTDQQFLAGMWQQVARLEREERELQRVRERNRTLRRRGIVTGLVAFAVVLALLALAVLLGVTVAGVAVVPLLGAFLLENTRNTTKEEEIYEQY